MSKGYLKAARWQMAALDEEAREWGRLGYRQRSWPAIFAVGFSTGILATISVLVLSIEYWLK